MIKLILHPNQPIEQSVELESRTILIGRSGENDLTLDDPSIASHHVRIEKRGEEFVVKDLSKQGILVDGEEVREAVISVGSVITLGEVDILFKGETAVAIDEHGAIIAEAELGPEAGALITTPQGMGRSAYLPTETFIQPAHLEPERSVASTLPLVSFISGALGPLLLGVGWLLGIILGFVSLANIRRRGGLLKDKRMATWGINLGFTWVVLVFALLAWQGWRGGVGRTVRANQVSAQRVLEGVCKTQYYARYGCFFDKNGNGAYEFGMLEDIESLHYSAMPDVARELRGYRLHIVRANEDGFLCYAEPSAYGRTGRLTYSIDESGVLRGKDLRGVPFTGIDRELPQIGEGKSVRETAGEEIASDLVETAARVLESAVPTNDRSGFERALRIVQETREHFPLTRTVETQLTKVTVDANPRVAELRATEEYNKAQALLEEGEVVRALNVLLAAEANYSTTASIEKIRTLAALIKEQHFRELEAAASAIYTEAQRLELSGRLTEAKQAYMKIKEQFSVTTYGQAIDERIGNVEAKIREQEAAGYIAKLRALRAEKDYIEIVQIVDLLRRGYAETEEYERNYELVEIADRKARAYSEAIQGVRHLNNEDYENALASFDKAIAAYPDIQAMIAGYLERCYLSAGTKAFERAEFRTALDLFERYRRLPPRENRLPDATLMRAYYEVGKLDYRQGNYDAAAQRLFVCSGPYSQVAEFNYVYGSVLLAQKDHREAVAYFNRYFEVTKADPKQRLHVPSLRKRGYSQAQLASELETEVKTLVLANAVYRPLVNTEAIRIPETSDDGQDSGEAVEDEQDDAKSPQEEEEENEERRRGGAGGPRSVLGGLGAPGDIRVHAQADGADAGASAEPSFRRILQLIVDIQKNSNDIDKEIRAAAGDSTRRQEALVRRSTMIEAFQQQQASIRIDIDRENTSKRDIILRIGYSADYLGRCVTDLQQVNERAGRNRQLEEVMAKLDHKRKMFAAAYTNLAEAHTQDLKTQHDAYALLESALKEFSGWPDPRDVGQSLRDMFMVRPGTEKMAEGLRMLLAGFDVEADLEIILRTGGETDL
ncbi:MAG: FHA domain-containing protein [Verrucomicrobia bacterium]|nr:FHA domain-containing protein [Verrucomicrobiota bacterium]